jgi:hypothetical protein
VPTCQAAAVLDAGLDFVEEVAAASLPLDELEVEDDESEPLVPLEPFADESPPLVLVDEESPVSLGRCWVDPPEELDRLSFL